MNSNYDWEAQLKTQLERLPDNVKRSRKLLATDLDGTWWLDILVELLKEFGTVDPTTQQKRWLEYDRAYKVLGTMTNGQHLVAEYKDLFSQRKLEDLVAYAKTQIPLIPGAEAFARFLDSMDIGVLAISNGARQIAGPKLEHHKLNFPLVSNWFEGDELKFVHDEHVGIDKGVIVNKLAEWGWTVVGFCGDAKGDIAGANAVHKLGGLVFACGHGGLEDWCARSLPVDSYVQYNDFSTVTAALQSRLCGA